MFIATHSTLYASGVAGIPDGTYAALDVTKLAATSRFAAVADPLLAFSVIRAATSVNQSGNTFSGTYAVSSIGGSDNTAAAAKHLAAVTSPDSVSSLGFTATVENGYVTSFKTTLPKAGADGADLVYLVELSNFGSAGTVSVPDASKVFAAPAEFYAG